jgi:hypothetical protein
VSVDSSTLVCGVFWRFRPSVSVITTVVPPRVGQELNGCYTRSHRPENGNGGDTFAVFPARVSFQISNAWCRVAGNRMLPRLSGYHENSWPPIII